MSEKCNRELGDFYFSALLKWQTWVIPTAPFRRERSELNPQGLVGPLEAEIGPLDLALGFAVLPEHETLDVVRPQILAQALERPRRVLDDALAVLFEAVVGERVGVALEVRPDRLVSAVGKPCAARFRCFGK